MNKGPHFSEPAAQTAPAVTIEQIAELLKPIQDGMAVLATKAEVEAVKEYVDKEIKGVRKAIPTDSQIVKVVNNTIAPLQKLWNGFMDEMRKSVNQIEVAVARIETASAASEKATELRVKEIEANTAKIEALELANNQSMAAQTGISRDVQAIRKMLVGAADEPDGPETVFGRLRALDETFAKKLTEFQNHMNERLTGVGTGLSTNIALTNRLTEAHNILVSRFDKSEADRDKYRKWFAGSLKAGVRFLMSRKGIAALTGTGSLYTLIRAWLDSLPSVILLVCVILVL